MAWIAVSFNNICHDLLWQKCNCGMYSFWRHTPCCVCMGIGCSSGCCGLCHGASAFLDGLGTVSFCVIIVVTFCCALWTLWYFAKVWIEFKSSLTWHGLHSFQVRFKKILYIHVCMCVYTMAMLSLLLQYVYVFAILGCFFSTRFELQAVTIMINP